MSTVDWVIVAVYLGLIVLVGLWASRRASASMDSFFVAGRALPWWIAGTSMLATSFSSDTPLHTTRQIRENGLGGAWFYWGGIIGSAGVAFFFARLWRRTGVVTDAELFELRYSGGGAAALRGTTAVFRGLVLEMITLSWVTLGMTKIVRTVIDLPDAVSILGLSVPADTLVVVVLVVLTMIYTVTSGLWGVVVTDLVEFALAMVGAVILATISFSKVGGPSGLERGLHAIGRGDALDFVPNLSTGSLPAIAIGVYVGVQWWATPYVDGSGQRAQRFLSCKDEGNALLAGVWSLTVQWIIRTWPWYVAALASLVLYPTLADGEKAYPRMVADLLPAGLRGIMVASFLAAFMSTFDGLLNLSASYISNDVYRRFVKRSASDRHYVRASRGITLIIALSAGTLALIIPSVLGAFRFKIELMAGLGLVAMLRWFWWRMNAATEIVTLVVSVGTAVGLMLHPELGASGAGPSALRILIIVGVSGVAMLTTAFVTKPEPEEKLLAFFERVRPPRALWGPIAEKAAPGDPGPISLHTVLQFCVCVVFVFSAMIGVGKLVLGSPILGVALIALAAGCFLLLWRWVLSGARSA